MSSVAGTYPWQERHWQQLIARARQKNLPHALVLTGPRGMGKVRFARELAYALLCGNTQADGRACGQCKSCRLLAAGSHPDLMDIGPDDAGKAIKVDQIREVCGFMSLTSQQGGYKVVIISPAEQMNVNASNSLLKTLEEPSPGALLLLVTAHPAGLLPTVRSRCQEVSFAPPATDEASAWLATQIEENNDIRALLDLAGGAPLQALTLHQSGAMDRHRTMLGDLEHLFAGQADPLATAGAWLDHGTEPALAWLAGVLMQIIRLKSGDNGTDSGRAASGLDLQEFAERLDLRELFGMLDRVNEAVRLTRTQVNARMLLEDILVIWSQLGARRQRASA